VSADTKLARNNFRAYILTRHNALDLRSDLLEDAKDFYFKGVLSFCEAVNSISRTLYSWATIKLYYSVYYLLRSTLATKYIALIRIRELFYLKANEGEQPKKITGRAGNTTHQGTIKVFERLFKLSDILQSNTIDGLNSYLWLMARREQINYREREFHDPGYPDFWQEVARTNASGQLNDLVSKYINDTRFIYSFQPDHACLALPVKRVILTKQDLTLEHVDTTFSTDQQHLLEDLLHSANIPSLLPVLF
jgi:hypothetical protein